MHKSTDSVSITAGTPGIADAACLGPINWFSVRFTTPIIVGPTRPGKSSVAKARRNLLIGA
jgi:hypothetical protein